MISTKSEVLNYIANLTFDVNLNHGEDLTAFSVAQYLSISRSLASQYLNELVRDGKLIKIKTRPVIFLHKEILLHSYNGISLSSEYLSIAQFRRLIDLYTRVGDFRSLIGHNISLDSAVQKTKASISYYPYTMPLLMVGEKGVGKRSISCEAYNYSIIKGFLKSDSVYEHIDVKDDDCYSNIIESSSDFLYVSNLNRMSKNSIKNILNIVKNRKGSIYMFSSEDDSLNKYFTLNVNISNFSDRYEVEKLNIVITLIKNYAGSLMRSLYIKESLLYALIELKYEDNIYSLRKLVEKIISERKSHNNDIYIDIQNIYNLVPDERLPYFIKKSKEEKYINIHKLDGNQEIIIESYQHLLDSDFSKEALDNYCTKVIVDCYFDKDLLIKIENDIRHLINVNPNINNDIGNLHANFIAKIVYLEKLFGNKLYHILNYNNDELLKYFNSVVLDDPNVHISMKNLMEYLRDYLNYDFHIVNIIIILKVMHKTV